jgi:sugar (pentulose or hexulose) kinase
MFRRQLADACRRTVVHAADGETAHSAIGAAAVAAMAVGHGRSPATAPATLETIAPQEERSALWDVLWERHEAALRALRAAPAADRAS